MDQDLIEFTETIRSFHPRQKKLKKLVIMDPLTDYTNAVGRHFNPFQGSQTTSIETTETIPTLNITKKGKKMATRSSNKHKKAPKRW